MRRKFISVLSSLALSVAVVVGAAALPAEAAAKSPVSVADTNAMILNHLSEPIMNEPERLFINWNAHVTGAHPVSVLESTGASRTFVFNDAGWLFNINSNDTWSTSTLSEVYEFDGAGRVVTHAFAFLDNGVPDEYGPTISTTAYTLNKKGQATKAKISSEGPATTKTISYDKLGRINKIKTVGAFGEGDDVFTTYLTYTYKNGYVTSMKMRYADDNITDTYNFVYDARGNLVTVADEWYSLNAAYDEQGRLFQFADSNASDASIRTYSY